MYCIVEFTESDPKSCEVIPTNWFTEDEKSCYWPPYKSTDNFTKAMVAPMTDWPIYAIRKIGSTIGWC